MLSKSDVEYFLSQHPGLSDLAKEIVKNDLLLGLNPEDLVYLNSKKKLSDEMISACSSWLQTGLPPEGLEMLLKEKKLTPIKLNLAGQLLFSYPLSEIIEAVREAEEPSAMLTWLKSKKTDIPADPAPQTTPADDEAVKALEAENKRLQELVQGQEALIKELQQKLQKEESFNRELLIRVSAVDSWRNQDSRPLGAQPTMTSFETSISNAKAEDMPQEEPAEAPAPKPQKAEDEKEKLWNRAVKELKKMLKGLKPEELPDENEISYYLPEADILVERKEKRDMKHLLVFQGKNSDERKFLTKLVKNKIPAEQLEVIKEGLQLGIPIRDITPLLSSGKSKEELLQSIEIMSLLAARK